MDNGSPSTSNTLDLVGAIQSMQGDTFADKSANYQKVLDARISRVGRGSAEWHRLLRIKGLVGGFIRFDDDAPLSDEVTECILAA